MGRALVCGLRARKRPSVSRICDGACYAARLEVRGRARQKLNALKASKLATARARELKEAFTHLWKYKSIHWARGSLDYWCFRAMRSRQIASITTSSTLCLAGYGRHLRP